MVTIKNIIFESPKRWHYWLIKRCLSCRFRVWVVEPFYAYHHEKGIRFYPPDIPRVILSLIAEGKVRLLNAADLNVQHIYLNAADSAVGIAEELFPAYKKAHSLITRYVCETLQSSVAEMAFRKQLSDKIAVFCSANIMLEQIGKKFSGDRIKVYPEVNVLFYRAVKEMLKHNGQTVFEHENITFPLVSYLDAFAQDIKEHFVALAKLFIQTVMSGLLFILSFNTGLKKKENYKYGITIISPSRQLAHNKRGPDFLIDNKKIHAAEVVYFTLARLSRVQKERLNKLKGDIYYLPYRKWQNFSHFFQWFRLLWIVMSSESGKVISVISDAHLLLSEYFRWQKVMEKITIKHFITHGDFGIAHIARNIALKQHGVQTWYFTDSMNFLINFQENSGENYLRHPFWSYFYYDHFVTWEKSLAEYFCLYPESFQKSHLVGCLWADHINGCVKTDETMHNKFVVAVFDSTYTRNGITSCAEGIAFAEHLLKLADEYSDILIIMKIKKNRLIYTQLDPVLGPKLLELYQVMKRRSNFRMYNDYDDISNLIAMADLTISFPFTSSTFEALSANRPAIWHDPMGYYRKTQYGKIGGVTTHGYDELKNIVMKIKNTQPGSYKNPIPPDSPFMDPYRDQNAIERFRDLLVYE